MLMDPRLDCLHRRRVSAREIPPGPGSGNAAGHGAYACIAGMIGVTTRWWPVSPALLSSSPRQFFYVVLILSSRTGGRCALSLILAELP